jgi:uncharacterized protein YkwD
MKKIFLFTAIFLALYGGAQWIRSTSIDEGKRLEYAFLFSEKQLSSISLNKLTLEDRINDYRKEKGLRPLTDNTSLNQTAQDSAKAIFTGERGWSHDGYIASISAQYTGWYTIGENLARNYDSIETVLRAWKESPSHNAILLGSKFCDVGVGVYNYVWVLHLGCKVNN